MATTRTADLARDAWRRALDDLPDLEAEAGRLRAGLERPDLVYGGHRVCDVLEPRFLDRAELDSLTAASAAVTAALNTAELAVVANTAELLPLVGEFGALETRLMAAPVRLARTDTSIRLDSAAGEDGWHFFEINGSIPGGLEIAHEIKTLFAGTPMYQRVGRELPLRMLDLKQRVCRSILDSWAAWGGTERPVIAIVDWLEGAGLIGEFRMIVRWMNELGYECFLADPTDLSIQGDRLVAGGRPIDVVYRRLIPHDMVGRELEVEPLVVAAERELACIIDPFVASVLDRKAIFALVTDPAVDLGFDAAMRAVLDASVPWTRRLVDGPATLKDGTPVDLLEYCRREREHLVIKPNHDFGGHGVFIGPTLDESAWDDAIATALEGEFVVQAAIASPVASFLSLSEPGKEVTLSISTDPYMFDGELGGVLSRLSGNGLSNVSSGGGVVPCFVVDA